MNPKLHDQLKQHFPNLFAEIRDFYVRDGWYNLIYAMCDTITHHMEYFPEEVRKQVHFTQVKEKFGGMRVHMSHEDDYISGITTMTEYISNTTCELCGSFGSRRTIGGYIQTLCSPCNDQEVAALKAR
jgi:hypothetical protein